MSRADPRLNKNVETCLELHCEDGWQNESTGSCEEIIEEDIISNTDTIKEEMIDEDNISETNDIKFVFEDVECKEEAIGEEDIIEDVEFKEVTVDLQCEVELQNESTDFCEEIIEEGITSNTDTIKEEMMDENDIIEDVEFKEETVDLSETNAYEEIKEKHTKINKNVNKTSETNQQSHTTKGRETVLQFYCLEMIVS